MNKHKKFRFVYMVLAAALLLSACLPTVTEDGTIKIDATQAAELVQTAVAQALAAKATEDAAAIPPATATEPEPTNTAIPAPATITPVPTITAVVLEPTTAPAGGGGGGSAPVKKEYQCALVSIDPPPSAASVFKPGEPFDVNITIENNGTATWIKGLDITYHNSASSTNFVPTFPSVLELPRDIKPGETFSFGPYDAFAPDKKGHYVMTFNVQGVDCWPYVAIDVK